MHTSARALAALLALAFSPLNADAAEDTPQALQKKCDAKDWAACKSLAYRYSEGDGVAKDGAKAGALYEKACNAGFGPACTSLAFEWDGGGLGTDKAKVARFATRACELEDAGGCYYHGRLLKEGDGVPKDLVRAARLLEQACNGEEGDACMELYLMLANGEGVPKDEARANVFYEKGCDLQSFICIMGYNLTFEPAIKQCDGGDARACYIVGTAHLRGEAYLTADEAKAREYLLKSCDGGFADACSELGWVYHHGKQSPKDATKAAGYYQKGCAGGDPYGCQQLGVLHLIGEGVAEDNGKAVDLLRRACNANKPAVAFACALLAKSYEQGSGVPRDPARAASLHAQACRLGEKESCAAKAAASPAGPRPKPVVAAPPAATPASPACSVAKVRLGSDTAAIVQRDIARRGGSASPGMNNGKPTLNALSGDYSDIGVDVMSVNYTFDAAGTSGRLIGVTIVNHASSRTAFDKLLAVRKSAAEAVVGTASACKLRLVPDAGTFYIYEIYEVSPQT